MLLESPLLSEDPRLRQRPHEARPSLCRRCLGSFRCEPRKAKLCEFMYALDGEKSQEYKSIELVHYVSPRVRAHLGVDPR